MRNPQNFLVTYGLHSFVTYTKKRCTHAFAIKGGESQKMVTHATNMIKENFGESANIQVV